MEVYLLNIKFLSIILLFVELLHVVTIIDKILWDDLDL